MLTPTQGLNIEAHQIAYTDVKRDRSTGNDYKVILAASRGARQLSTQTL